MVGKMFVGSAHQDVLDLGVIFGRTKPEKQLSKTDRKPSPARSGRDVEGAWNIRGSSCSLPAATGDRSRSAAAMKRRLAPNFPGFALNQRQVNVDSFLIS